MTLRLRAYPGCSRPLDTLRFCGRHSRPRAPSSRRREPEGRGITFLIRIYTGHPDIIAHFWRWLVGLCRVVRSCCGVVWLSASVFARAVLGSSWVSRAGVCLHPVYPSQGQGSGRERRGEGCGVLRGPHSCRHGRGRRRAGGAAASQCTAPPGTRCGLARARVCLCAAWRGVGVLRGPRSCHHGPERHRADGVAASQS